MEEAEEELSEMAEKNKTDIKKILKLVKLNEIILQEKRQLVKADIMHSLVSTVLMSENDESGTFDDHEITRLVRFLNGLPAIKFNEELLIKKVTENRSLSSVLSLLMDIECDDIPADQRIFMINEKKFAPREPPKPKVVPEPDDISQPKPANISQPKPAQDPGRPSLSLRELKELLPRDVVQDEAKPEISLLDIKKFLSSDMQDSCESIISA